MITLADIERARELLRGAAYHVTPCARSESLSQRAGCELVAVPYDITKISQMADELESSWHRMFLLADHYAVGRSEAFRTRIRRVLIGRIRAEVLEA